MWRGSVQVVSGVSVGDDHDIGPSERLRWLPHQPRRQQPTVSKRIDRISQDNIQIAIESEMLKPVIQNDDAGVHLLKSNLTNSVSVGSRQDSDARQMPGQQIGLVGGNRRLTPQTFAVADDRWFLRTTSIPP